MCQNVQSKGTGVPPVGISEVGAGTARVSVLIFAKSCGCVVGISARSHLIFLYYSKPV